MHRNQLQISPTATECANHAILVTGSARSGTTIMGQLISSLENVEFAYEPPMLLTILSLIGEVGEHQWRMLYETYLYEEFLMNVLAGRVFNFNKFDNSSILKTKSQVEIDRRLNLDLPKSVAEELAPKYTVAYKIPDIVAKVSLVKNYYPSMKVVVMLRDAVGTINSVIQRGWFNKNNEKSSLIWPFMCIGNVRVPFWVLPQDVEYWINLSEIDRAAYYYVRVNEDLIGINGRIEIKYGDLLRAPKLVMGNLADELGFRFSEKTEEILRGIKRTEKNRDLNVIEKIRQELRVRVSYYSDQSI